MRPSLLRRLAFPPPPEPQAPAAELRQQARARSITLAGAILLDAALVLLLRESPAIRPSALRAFGEINITLLSIDLVLVNLLTRKRSRWLTVGQATCFTIEIVTAITWIQLTGTVSSYFLLVGPFLVVACRVLAGYWVAVWGTGVLVTGHVGAFAAEELHLLRPASLFIEGAGLYAAPLFRWAALSSILCVYAVVFCWVNFVATAFREKDVALNAARKDVERAIEEGQPGRLVGETIGGYALREVLGRGGMGEVYGAERVADGREAAVKVLQRHLGAQPDVVARFQREIDAVKRMKARGVAEVFDAGVTPDGVHYLVMELLRGEDMASLLRRRERLPLAELLAIVEPLAEALDAAHALGIVHRDVKPQNVFLAHDATGSGTVVKLLDFGIARLLETTSDEKLTATFAVVGTPGYLAPEQIAPTLGTVGAETDVFALGAVAYRALTGRPAFGAAHFGEMVDAVLHGRPLAPSEIVADVTPDVDAVVALALAKRPRDRYASARAFATELRAAHEGRLGEETRDRARALAPFSLLPSGSTLASSRIRTSPGA